MQKGEKELNDGLMEDVEDKCEQYSGSTDDEGLTTFVMQVSNVEKHWQQSLPTAKICLAQLNVNRLQKERLERRLDRAKRRAQNSQLIRELRDELEDRPEEIREECSTLANGLESYKAQARKRYEESNFVRLGMSREERKAAKRRKHNTSMVDELGKLLEFGRYKVPTEDEIEGKRAKTPHKSNKFKAAVSSEKIPRKIKRHVVKGRKKLRMKKRTKR
ncbi:hypothetical protein Mgra_00002378 [Meloidogyne graminicola]|uniref:Uncharacterized protein n=1 Tax=Meloidogyne graminicola TaxID=189291 RepID=A0A8S9ZXX8_9BILA|nr:hypothetical protein Mgra_00002378 [Meloidogyne graminicola]